MAQFEVYDQVSNYDPLFYNVYRIYSWSKYQVMGRIARFAILHRRTYVTQCTRMPADGYIAVAGCAHMHHCSLVAVPTRTCHRP